MSLLQINSAVSLAEPLLEQEREQLKLSNLNDNDDNYDDDDEEEIQTVVPIEGECKSRIKFFAFGAFTGFFIQVVSLTAYACLLINSTGMFLTDSEVMSMDDFFQQANLANEAVDMTSGGQNFGKDVIVYTLLSIMTHIDLIVYVLIWVGFTCTMTRYGMKCINTQFFSSTEGQSSQHAVQQRYVFVLGVSFLVGIVIGAFGAWFAIDLYLDFPIPLKPILVTVVVDLALCYMMIMCFDMGGYKKSKSKKNQLSKHSDVEGVDADIIDDEEGYTMCC